MVSWSMKDFVIVVIGTWLVHLLCLVVYHGFYLLIEKYDIFSQHRINKSPKQPISWEQKIQEFYRQLTGVLVEQLPLLIISYPLFHYFGISSTADLPTFTMFCFQFLVFNILEDTGFYWVHRLLHHPYLYGKIHARHHEFTETFSLNASYSHPIEFLFNVLLPLMSGPFLFGYFIGLHISIFWIWIAFREMRGADAHSGYHLPFHPLRLISPIYKGPKYHDFHHSVKGRNTNFAGYFFWDSICGTIGNYEKNYD
jgi:sterol desaturase/sphingolipid hydroxylase (fatty acid hydroxylase superfamily)